MLGVVEYPYRTPADEVMEKVADEHGRRRHLPPDAGRRLLRRPRPAARRARSPTRTSAAPGPDRNTCLNCGECMTGCRHNAKNTLVKNYLYLAEQNGAVVHPLTTVTRVAPARRRRLRGRRPGAPRPSSSRRTAVRTLTAEQVVFAAAVARHPEAAAPDEGRGPPARDLSDRLGYLSRTNSESILGAIAPDTDAPTTPRASRSPRRFHPDEHTHIEPVRYGKGSNAMALMQTVLTDGDGAAPRWRTWLQGDVAAAAPTCVDLYDFKHWSERTVIALVMQTLDNSITTVRQADAVHRRGG